jgi:predicted dehydrogenase
MSLSHIRWGILGTSTISEVMAQAIQESSISQLVAIGSRSVSTGNAFANKFSIPKFYTDYQALLNDSEIDAIYIGLPNHLHKEWVIHCAQAQKHILCEKPFVISAKEAQEAFSVVEKSNVFCMEALMYCYHPLTKKLRELIQNKVIGDIKLFNATYTANIAAVANPTAGGSIRNLGCYPISLVRLLANAEPSEITALGRVNNGIPNDNQASAILKFENQTMAVVSTADDMEMFWQFDVYGTNGSLKMITNPWLPDRDNNKIIINYNNKTSVEINVTAEKSLYAYQIDAMSNKIRNNISTHHDEVSWQDSLGNITVLDTWLQQVKANL